LANACGRPLNNREELIVACKSHESIANEIVTVRAEDVRFEPLATRIAEKLARR